MGHEPPNPFGDSGRPDAAWEASDYPPSITLDDLDERLDAAVEHAIIDQRIDQGIDQRIDQAVERVNLKLARLVPKVPPVPPIRPISLVEDFLLEMQRSTKPITKCMVMYFEEEPDSTLRPIHWRANLPPVEALGYLEVFRDTLIKEMKGEN